MLPEFEPPTCGWVGAAIGADWIAGATGATGATDGATEATGGLLGFGGVAGAFEPLSFELPQETIKKHEKIRSLDFIGASNISGGQWLDNMPGRKKLHTKL